MNKTRRERHVVASENLSNLLTIFMRLTLDEQAQLEEALEEFVDARIERDRDKLESDRLWRD